MIEEQNIKIVSVFSQRDVFCRSFLRDLNLWPWEKKKGPPEAGTESDIKNHYSKSKVKQYLSGDIWQGVKFKQEKFEAKNDLKNSKKMP